jgi:hypothetical protein
LTTTHPEGEHHHPLQVIALDHDCSTVVFAKADNSMLSPSDLLLAAALGVNVDYRAFIDLDIVCADLVSLAEQARAMAVTENEHAAVETFDYVAKQFLDIRTHHLGGIVAQESVASVQSLGDIDWGTGPVGP